MNVKKLNEVMRIASRVTNPSSLTKLYRSVEISQNGLRVASEFGIFTVVTEDSGLIVPALLDAESVMAVVASLPPSSNLILTREEGKINWKAGRAKGSWNLVASDNVIPVLNHDSFPWTPPETLATALLLASSACQAAAVSVGLYGITIEPVGEDLKLTSSNSISLASTTVPKGNYPTGKITVRPPVPSILAMLMNVATCTLDVTNDGIFVNGCNAEGVSWIKAQLPLGADLNYDLAALANQFAAITQVSPIDGDAVKKFLARARVMQDRNASFTVNLSVSEGNLILEHSGISASTEEVFLASGLDSTLTYQSTALAGDMLLIPLGAADRVVLDYLGARRLILRGNNPDFLFVVSGAD
jgi:hypothetical protein